MFFLSLENKSVEMFEFRVFEKKLRPKHDSSFWKKLQPGSQVFQTAKANKWQTLSDPFNFPLLVVRYSLETITVGNKKIKKHSI